MADEKITDLEKIIEENRELYPLDDVIERARSQSALEIVVRAILSQNTSDRLSDAAFQKLKGEVEDLRRVPEIPSARLQKLIKVCGLPRIKTKRMKEAIRRITERFPDPEAMRNEDEQTLFEFLTSIKGIGPKSASVIMAFLGFDAFPVDTHVARIIRRIGIAKGTRERIFKEVSPKIKNKLVTHLFLISHGRNVCRARRPLCFRCVFHKICDSRERENLTDSRVS